MAQPKEDFLTQLRELGKRSGKIGEQLELLLSQYENQSTYDEQYQRLLKEFGLEDELRKTQKGVRRFKMASMLYIVIHGFNTLSQRNDSQKQMDLLDEICFNISDIAQKYGLIKIPTIGDNIMLAGGITTENKTNPIDATLAAFEIVTRINRRKEDTDCIWEVGIGLHTGPIMGRFLPGKNTPYTLSGNNALIASRLGAISPKGHVSLSLMTYELIKEFFEVNQVGKVPVKYSGSMDIFDLLDIVPSLRSDMPNKLTNDAFDLAYSRLQFMDIQEYMLDMLEEKLPKYLHYHSVKHTIDVTTEVELIGWAEGLPESDIMLLKVAGLFHDSGHIVTYAGHEEESCKFADEILPMFKYSQEKIDTIKRIIMATKLPHTPSDILEAIIQDSDLDYLGRTDFVPVSNMLYQELLDRGINISVDQWNENQIKFISAHQYYTNTARTLREVNKQSQIERLHELLDHSNKENDSTEH
ncbi:MAG: HD domain-containing protein [Bacteroidales bacterium]|nr:HD domain-containing protein [Bacteroidales bacterium]